VNKYAKFYFSSVTQKLAENPANHGVTFWPFKRTFGRPKGLSDYAFAKMQERGRLASGALPGIISSNPIMKVFGRLGENRIAQYFIDKYLTPGGGYGDAYMKTLKSFGTRFGGTGIKNLSAASEASKNILNNVNKAFSNQDGLWDYKKSYGYDRSQTIDNLSMFQKHFGGGM